MNARDLGGVVNHARVLDTASELIRVPGHQDLESEERAVSDRFAELAAELTAGSGAEVVVDELPDGRRNVMVRVSGRRPGSRLLFNGHLDTVPGYAMRDAYVPNVRDGRLYGRGAVDMKGALAAMLETAAVLADPTIDLAGELVILAVVGEENGSPGMQHHVRAGIGADFAVVGEPTNLRVATAHKGAMWVEARFPGLATHGSTPEHGVNAVYRAARFVRAVEEVLSPQLERRTHPLLGSATTSVGVIRGGDRPPMVPAHCNVQLDRRWLPGERHEDVLAEYLALARDGDDVGAPPVTVEEMAGTASFVHAPLDCPPELPPVRALRSLVSQRLGVPDEPIGVTFWTDGALLAAATDTPTVVCGPGDIAQAHSLDEWVSLEQLAAAADVYTALAVRLLDANGPATPTRSTR